MQNTGHEKFVMVTLCLVSLQRVGWGDFIHNWMSRSFVPFSIHFFTRTLPKCQMSFTLFWKFSADDTWLASFVQNYPTRNFGGVILNT